MVRIINEAFTFFSSSVRSFEALIPLIRTLIFVIVAYMIFSVTIRFLGNKLLKKANSKKQINNIEIFTRLARYVFLILLLISAIFTYSGSLTGIGLTFGLISAAIGFALQKPITSIGAWVMIIFKRPFVIGDRIVVGNLKGDVKDITISHIYLEEVGGLYEGEERTGRTVMISNHRIFDENIINYSLFDDYVLGQVKVLITYESNFDKAIKLGIQTAKKRVETFTSNPKFPENKKEPHIRVSLADDGVELRIRYYVHYNDLTKIASDIATEMHKEIMKMKDVEIAYPHTELIYRKKGS